MGAATAAKINTTTRRDLSKGQEMETQPTLLIVADDQDAPDSIAGALSSLDIAVRQLPCASDALAACRPEMPGCYVIDHRIGGVDGLFVRQQLVAQGCQQPFIFVSRRGDVASAVEAMHQGALDCIPRPLDHRRLLNRVREAIAGDAKSRRTRVERATVLARADSLSARETQVLGLVAAGFITKEIARDLAISPKTVEVHRSNIMKKMRVESAAELLHTIAKYSVVPFTV